MPVFGRPGPKGNVNNPEEKVIEPETSEGRITPKRKVNNKVRKVIKPETSEGRMTPKGKVNNQGEKMIEPVTSEGRMTPKRKGQQPRIEGDRAVNVRKENDSKKRRSTTKERR